MFRELLVISTPHLAEIGSRTAEGLHARGYIYISLWQNLYILVNHLTKAISSYIFELDYRIGQASLKQHWHGPSMRRDAYLYTNHWPVLLVLPTVLIIRYCKLGYFGLCILIWSLFRRLNLYFPSGQLERKVMKTIDCWWWWMKMKLWITKCWGTTCIRLQGLQNIQ